MAGVVTAIIGVAAGDKENIAGKAADIDQIAGEKKKLCPLCGPPIIINLSGQISGQREPQESMNHSDGAQGKPNGLKWIIHVKAGP
ncbi:hypothetical protein SDC9_192234 [bioreactor metagenome]|uniref:Uncharacterized protein n=1 Tax=bioreactor metagenome TaxID=1076179 RepID=A0A645I2L8_9ZZZZ